MSGDVQPRKRKDKKRKKDDLGVEEPRGTAAALGEGDVFMHSQHEHGTGGHWCAKIIFFSLLAVLITLIGLIILENRGLSELEANAVESRYSGVLEGWLEDAPDDDHHDEHTLELTHHDDEEHEEDHDSAEEEIEVEKLEREEPDEEPLSTELPALPEDDDDDNDDDPDDKIDDGDLSEAESDQEEFEQAEEENEYLENDDIDDPEVEPITTIPGKPLPEVEEEISSEQPPDTLAEEEEYEKRQEELRREEEQSSHMWLKLTVGGALLVATHAVMRRATRSHDSPDDEEPAITEDIPLIDRRLTLIPEEQSKCVPVKKILEEISERSFDKVVGSAAFSGKTALGKKQESEEEEKYSDEEEPHDTALSADDNKELYSDDEQAEDDEEIVEEPKQIVKQSAPVVESKPMSEPEGDLDLEEDDVEIIDDEQLEEELEEEDEEEISDVDDAELLTRLEEKYGKLPEPERPGQKFYKDGGNSIDDVWPGEPSDAYWRDQLDSAERELLQDWLD